MLVSVTCRGRGRAPKWWPFWVLCTRVVGAIGDSRLSAAAPHRDGSNIVVVLVVVLACRSQRTERYGRQNAHTVPPQTSRDDALPAIVATSPRPRLALTPVFRRCVAV